MLDDLHEISLISPRIKTEKCLLQGTPAGYVHQCGKFTEALVRNAGHMVPYDQSVNALDLITRFINDKPFNN